MKYWVRSTFIYLDPEDIVLHGLDGVTDPEEAKRLAWRDLRSGDILTYADAEDVGSVWMFAGEMEISWRKRSAPTKSFRSPDHAPRCYTGRRVYWWEPTYAPKDFVYARDMLDSNMHPIWMCGRTGLKKAHFVDTPYDVQVWYDDVRTNPSKCTDLGSDSDPLQVCVTARPDVIDPDVVLFFRGGTAAHAEEIGRLGYKWTVLYDAVHGYILPERRMWVKIVSPGRANAEIEAAKAIGAAVEQKISQAYLDKATARAELDDSCDA